MHTKHYCDAESLPQQRKKNKDEAFDIRPRLKCWISFSFSKMEDQIRQDYNARQ